MSLILPVPMSLLKLLIPDITRNISADRREETALEMCQKHERVLSELARCAFLSKGHLSCFLN